MESFNRKNHWENIYQTKMVDEVSWYQPIPETSLDFIKQFNIPLSAKIIDIGGGDSFLADHLLKLGYYDITVLDISEKVIERAQQRLGDKAKNINWIIADAATFTPLENYDFWHDRATFHFLTDEQEITNYVNTVHRCINPSGILLIGAFSDEGPKTCSGIKIKQYSEASMMERFKNVFKKLECIRVNHKTPAGSIQNFVFCSFRKMY